MWLAFARKCCFWGILIRGAAILICAYGLFSAESARAVPSFARQTGMGCPICHTNFPELTPFGREFKLNGFTLSTGESDLPPLAMMVQTAFTNTQASQSGGAAHNFGPNDNLSVEAVSFFYGGKIFDNFGALAQATWSETANNFNWDNSDVRYANTTSLFDHDVTFGFTFNNNPTLSDIYNTTQAWGFPFASPSLAPHPAAHPLIQSLAQQVAALGGYTMTDDTLYAEFDLYKSLSAGAQRALGIHPDGETELDHVAPYWRVALQHQWNEHFVEGGTYGLFSNTFPGRTHGFGTDKIVDYGVDAQYQYLTEHHVAELYTNFVHEDQTLGASQAAGISANPSNTLNSFNIRGSYIYSQDWSRYGFTTQWFSINGSTDTGLFAPAPITGSNNGSPNSRGWIFELDYMPFINTQPLSFWPWAQVKLSLQYTLYNKFNGAGRNYDGSGRNASDNNTLFLLAWFAF